MQGAGRRRGRSDGGGLVAPSYAKRAGRTAVDRCGEGSGAGGRRRDGRGEVWRGALRWGTGGVDRADGRRGGSGGEGRRDGAEGGEGGGGGGDEAGLGCRRVDGNFDVGRRGGRAMGRRNARCDRGRAGDEGRKRRGIVRRGRSPLLLLSLLLPFLLPLLLLPTLLLVPLNPAPNAPRLPTLIVDGQPLHVRSHMHQRRRALPALLPLLPSSRRRVVLERLSEPSKRLVRLHRWRSRATRSAEADPGR